MMAGLNVNECDTVDLWKNWIEKFAVIENNNNNNDNKV